MRSLIVGVRSFLLQRLIQGLLDLQELLSWRLAQPKMACIALHCIALHLPSGMRLSGITADNLDVAVAILRQL